MTARMKTNLTFLLFMIGLILALAAQSAFGQKNNFYKELTPPCGTDTKLSWTMKYDSVMGIAITVWDADSATSLWIDGVDSTERVSHDVPVNDEAIVMWLGNSLEMVTYAYKNGHPDSFFLFEAQDDETILLVNGVVRAAGNKNTHAIEYYKNTAPGVVGSNCDTQGWKLVEGRQ